MNLLQSAKSRKNLWSEMWPFPSAGHQDVFSHWGVSTSQGLSYQECQFSQFIGIYSIRIMNLENWRSPKVTCSIYWILTRKIFINAPNYMITKLHWVLPEPPKKGGGREAMKITWLLALLCFINEKKIISIFMMYQKILTILVRNSVLKRKPP